LPRPRKPTKATGVVSEALGKVGAATCPQGGVGDWDVQWPRPQLFEGVAGRSDHEGSTGTKYEANGATQGNTEGLGATSAVEVIDNCTSPRIG
jgi:hypothetical protein